ncbi:MAG: zinc-ribbon domain-containing protein [Deltaproteobacteria bacterium]|nr:zinc-ribbon domain-containing protein [Deltaproteobacteria bacterium]
MIIHCPQCRTGFRFDERHLRGEGIWVRCSRCRRVFFHEASPVRKDIAGIPADTRDRKEGNALHDATSVIDAIDHREYGAGSPRGEMPPSMQDNVGNGISSSSGEGNGKSSRALRWSLTALVIYFVFVVCVVGGVYLWLFSDIPALISERIASISITLFEKAGERGTTGAVNAGTPDISFSDIEDRFTSNWILGTLLVVKGTAVNNGSFPVSEIKVKGRVFNAADEVLAVSESYCGNILSEEQLSNLTAKEIREELTKAQGSSFSNDGIPGGGTIPFMLVYINPTGGVDEISIELAGAKRPAGSRQ